MEVITFYFEKLKSFSLPTTLEQYFGNLLLPIALISVALLAILAFKGYKIFKVILIAVGALIFGVAGDAFLVPLIPASVLGFIPTNIPVNAAALVSVLCAVIGAFIAAFAHKVFIFLIGGGVGYYLGSTLVISLILKAFPTLAFLNTPTFKIVLSVLCAVFAAILALLVFKLVYIVATSVGGMVAAGVILAVSIFPGAPETFSYVAMALGGVIGVIAAAYQFKQDSSADFDFR